MVVQMLLNRKSKCLSVDIVLVAMELHSLKAPVVVKALVDDTDGDDGVYQPEIPGDLKQRCEDQGDAVAR